MSDRKGMGDLLKRRMTESQQASELTASNQAYEKIFRQSAPAVSPLLTNLALNRLLPFFTEDRGHHSRVARGKSGGGKSVGVPFRQNHV